jgi:multidrug efflux pump subunit AcrA (membrane-fusion protein)
LDEFCQRVHGRLELTATAYTAANEARRILDCDRVSVLVRRGARQQLVAISGLDAFDRRSNSVRCVESLTAATATLGEALWYPQPQEERPQQLAESLEAYLDECHARGLAILPLRGDGSPGASPGPGAVGALVVERFYAPLDEPLRKTALALCPHVALAVQNALELERLPLGRLLRRLRGVVELARGRRLAAAALIGLAVAALVALLILVPADFTVEARGELQPCDTRDIFAPDEGVVRELRVASGQQVAADQVLLVLRKPELDLEFKRVGGELQTARQKLAAVETEQLQNRREDEGQRRRATELTAQQEELRAVIASLESQYAILQRQQAELEIRSPLAGELLTWSAEQLLASRPVVRGQVLLTVADLSGPWGLELRIPDRRLWHVLQARRQTSDPLAVSFSLATNPGQVLSGTLDRVGQRTEMAETEGAVVLATARIDPAEMPELVPGAGVVARVHCGRRAIGYVWLHDLIDAVRSWFLF